MKVYQVVSAICLWAFLDLFCEGAGKRNTVSRNEPALVGLWGLRIFIFEGTSQVNLQENHSQHQGDFEQFPSPGFDLIQSRNSSTFSLPDSYARNIYLGPNISKKNMVSCRFPLTIVAWKPLVLKQRRVVALGLGPHARVSASFCLRMNQ